MSPSVLYFAEINAGRRHRILVRGSNGVRIRRLVDIGDDGFFAGRRDDIDGQSTIEDRGSSVSTNLPLLSEKAKMKFEI